MNTKLLRRACLVLGAAFAFGAVAVGCSQNSPEAVQVTETPTETPTPQIVVATPEVTVTPEITPEPVATYMSVGVEEEGAYRVLFTNATGHSITSMDIKRSDQPDFTDALVAPADAIANGAQFAFFYKPSQDAQASASASDDSMTAADMDEAGMTGGYEDQVAYNDGSLYDIEVTMDQEESFVLYDVDFNDIDTASICWDTIDRIGYLEYISLRTNEPVSTLGSQKAHAEAAGVASPSASASALAPVATKAPSSGGSSSGGSSSNGGGGGGGSASTPAPTAAPATQAPATQAPAPPPTADPGGHEPEQSAGDCTEDNIVWID